MPLGLTIGGGLASAGISAIGAASAAKTQAAAADKARQTQLDMYNQTREDLSPYNETGKNALYSLAQLYGIPSPGNPNPGEAFNEKALETFRKSPDYEFALKEGQRSIEAGAAAKGGLYSGGAMTELQKYGQGMATQNFGNYVNRLLQLSQIGYGAAGQSGNAALSTGRGMAETDMAAGEARASGIVGVTNNITGGISDATNSLATWNRLNSGGQSSYGAGVTNWLY